MATDFCGRFRCWWFNSSPSLNSFFYQNRNIFKECVVLISRCWINEPHRDRYSIIWRREELVNCLLPTVFCPLHRGSKILEIQSAERCSCASKDARAKCWYFIFIFLPLKSLVFPCQHPVRLKSGSKIKKSQLWTASRKDWTHDSWFIRKSTLPLS